MWPSIIAATSLSFMPGRIFFRAHRPCRWRRVHWRAHALDFLRRLDHAQFGEKRRGVNNFFRNSAETHRNSPACRDRRLSYHAIANLRALRQLDADAAGQFSFAQHFEALSSERVSRRARILRMIEIEIADVFIPRACAALREIAARRPRAWDRPRAERRRCRSPSSSSNS